MYLIESIFKKFSDVAVGNKDIIKMLVTTVHPDEVRNASLFFFFAFFLDPSLGQKGPIKQGLSLRPSFCPTSRLSVSFLGIG